MKKIREGFFLSAILFLFFFSINTAAAMRISSHESVFAWSDDGRGCLIIRSQYGPEGGGSLSFRLIAPAKKIDESFEISRDFSPGGSEHPETVSDNGCRSALKKLLAVFKDVPFSSVKVDLGAVTRDRHLTVLSYDTNGKPGYFWSSSQAKERPTVEKAEYRMGYNGEMFILKRHDRTVVEWKAGNTPGMSYDGALSPTGMLFLIFVSGEMMDRELTAVFERAPGTNDVWTATDH